MAIHLEANYSKKLGLSRSMTRPAAIAVTGISALPRLEGGSGNYGPLSETEALSAL